MLSDVRQTRQMCYATLRALSLSSQAVTRMEVAPQVGLSNWIVDLVATGRTLRENKLAVVEEIAVCTARLVANRVAYARHRERIAAMVEKLEAWAAR